jgi:hypothetical protein
MGMSGEETRKESFRKEEKHLEMILNQDIQVPAPVRDSRSLEWKLEVNGKRVQVGHRPNG